MPVAQVDTKRPSSSSSSPVPHPKPDAIPLLPRPPIDDDLVDLECVGCGVEDQLGGDGNVGHRDLNKEALSAKHILTHLPHNPWCFACMRAKLVANPCKRKHKKSDANNFGDLVTGGHFIVKSE
eukprot:10998301-Heterocapsa_arctica.AAC.1